MKRMNGVERAFMSLAAFSGLLLIASMVALAIG